MSSALYAWGIFGNKTLPPDIEQQIFLKFENNLLNVIPKGYTVIMDNAAFHRKKEL
jgi:hypothetical protein